MKGFGRVGVGPWPSTTPPNFMWIPIKWL